MKRPEVPILFFVLCVFSVSCANRSDRPGEDSETTGVSIILKADRLAVERHDSFTVVTILNPWQGAEDVSQVYYLVKSGMKAPEEAEPARIIIVPVRKIVCMSSTHLAMVSALGEQETIAGISGIRYIYNDSLRSRAGNGYIREVGYDSDINEEVILKTDPDLIMMYGIGSESAGYVGKLSEMGIKVMFDADYLETDPLGKAEWIKLFGALYCKEELADSIFGRTVREYNEIKKIILRKTGSRPKVLLGLPFRDTWFISPANSYMSTLISDAGGKYLWDDKESSVSMPYSLESVYIKSLKADFWLNPGNAASRRDIATLEPRLEKIPCYISGNIYNNTKRMSPGGGNDYWESGTLNPHILLKDIASILHPGIFEGHQLSYYKKIE